MRHRGWIWKRGGSPQFLPWRRPNKHGRRPCRQPDAGAKNGGDFSLTGGFWSLIAAVRSEGAPRLAIFRTTTNTIVVAWPSATTWNLQQNTNSISSVNWSYVTRGIRDDGRTKRLIVNPPAGNRFYRLK